MARKKSERAPYGALVVTSEDGHALGTLTVVSCRQYIGPPPPSYWVDSQGKAHEVDEFDPPAFDSDGRPNFRVFDGVDLYLYPDDGTPLPEHRSGLLRVKAKLGVAGVKPQGITKQPGRGEMAGGYVSFPDFKVRETVLAPVVERLVRAGLTRITVSGLRKAINMAGQ